MLLSIYVSVCLSQQLTEQYFPYTYLKPLLMETSSLHEQTYLITLYQIFKLQNEKRHICDIIRKSHL